MGAPSVFSRLPGTVFPAAALKVPGLP